MNHLSDQARQMLERYKSAESMPPVAKDKALEVVLLRGARGDLPRFDVNIQPPTAPTAGWTQAWSLPAKVLAALGAAALPTLMVVRAMTHHAPGPASNPSPAQAITVEPSPAALPATDPESAAVAPTEPSTVEPTPAVTPPESLKRAARAAASTRVAPTSASATEAPAAPTIDGEILLLNQAQLATRAGQPARALQILDEYSAQYPNGRMADARAVGRMVALCDLGQVAEVRHEAEQFKVRYPNSPFSDRVNKICAAKTP